MVRRPVDVGDAATGLSG